MKVITRIANEADMPVILSIVNYEIRHSTAIYDYDPRSLTDQLDWFRKKQQENLPVLVAELDGRVIGFATYGMFRPRIAYRFTVEHSIYIDREARGKGAGTRLMQQLIELARKAGYHVMIAGVDASNGGSYAFHQKFGFTEVARLREVGFKFDRWLDLILMQLFL
jgi:L-amino acid N-acyltransferase